MTRAPAIGQLNASHKATDQRLGVGHVARVNILLQPREGHSELTQKARLQSPPLRSVGQDKLLKANGHVSHGGLLIF